MSSFVLCVFFLLGDRWGLCSYALHAYFFGLLWNLNPKKLKILMNQSEQKNMLLNLKSAT